jgi:hypothetical protein
MTERSLNKLEAISNTDFGSLQKRGRLKDFFEMTSNTILFRLPATGAKQ